MEFLQLIQKRKSIRSFSNKSVPRELIDKILVAATHAPTTCNQQLWNFTIIEDEATKESLIKNASSSTLIRRAPVIVVVSYDGWNYKEAIQSGSLAVGNMLLAATEYGLGSLPMNSYGADSKIKKILNISQNQVICCFVLLGYPDERAELAPIVPRRDVKDVTHWGKFSNDRQISYQYNPETWTREDLIAHQRFYCRKTFIGKEMDIMSQYERNLVRRELISISGPVLDYFSYDGAYLREFPPKINLTALELCKETALYTTAAASLVGRKIEAQIFDPHKKTSTQNFKTNTIIFKTERIPSSLRRKVYRDMQGDLVIVARKQNVFLSVFLFAIKSMFGSDVRKTGIFTFFGPYRPISLNETIGELRDAGFKNIRWHGYFILPAFCEQIYQMFLQYKSSEGSSYLHRESRSNYITKIISLILRVQGLKRFGRFGSVIVIKCRK